MSYFECLDAPSQKWYLEKTAEIGCLDPYTIPDDQYGFVWMSRSAPQLVKWRSHGSWYLGKVLLLKKIFELTKA